MRFLVDAQLPRRLARLLTSFGYDAVHTLDLPRGNLTTDIEVNDHTEREQRIVVTKDADFVTAFLLVRRPPKLWLISTGNIRDAELDALIVSNFTAIETAFAQYDL